MTQSLGFEIDMPLGFDATVGRVKEVLKQEGFGVPTEIDLRAISPCHVGLIADLFHASISGAVNAEPNSLLRTCDWCSS